MSEHRIELDAVSDLPFGARLRRMREAAGLTQEELAARAGLSRNAVGALERGLRKRPYPHTVRSLALALELSGEERAALFSVVPKEGCRDTRRPWFCIVSKVTTGAYHAFSNVWARNDSQALASAV